MCLYQWWGFDIFGVFFLHTKPIKEENEIKWKIINFHLTNVLSVTDCSESYKKVQYNNKMKTSLPLYQEDRFYWEQWACVAANTLREVDSNTQR